MVTFLKIGKYGRLGNQLFQFASTVGIAEANGQPWGFPKWDHPFVPDFPGIDKRKFKQIRIRDAYSGRKWRPYTEVKIKDDEDVSLFGYLQNERYFKHCEGLIRHLFTFKDKVKPPKRCEKFIALHIRRGDYGKKTHPTIKKDYYERALNMMPDLPVIIFTDDKRGARKMFPYCYIAGSTPFRDLNLMTKATCHVISNSTFAWWGAWLAESQRVIAPLNWFGDGRDGSYIYPKEWIILSL